ncbi:MAG TPA: hypothetical protein VI248_01620 [Kineosporiaceae bacterium]
MTITAGPRRFAVRQNAVLWLSGPPPAGLRLHLPDGAWQAPPDPHPVVVPQLPAWFCGPAPDSVGLLAVFDRAAAFGALEHVLAGRLVEELRTRRGVAYSPEAHREPLTGTVARLLVTTDVVPGRQEDAARAFLATVQARPFSGRGSGRGQVAGRGRSGDGGLFRRRIRSRSSMRSRWKPWTCCKIESSAAFRGWNLSSVAAIQPPEVKTARIWGRCSASTGISLAVPRQRLNGRRNSTRGSIWMFRHQAACGKAISQTLPSMIR